MADWRQRSAEDDDRVWPAAEQGDVVAVGHEINGT